jgi:hypothetical protein
MYFGIVQSTTTFSLWWLIKNIHHKRKKIEFWGSPQLINVSRHILPSYYYCFYPLLKPFNAMSTSQFKHDVALQILALVFFIFQMTICVPIFHVLIYILKQHIIGHANYNVLGFIMRFLVTPIVHTCFFSLEKMDKIHIQKEKSTKQT